MLKVMFMSEENKDINEKKVETDEMVTSKSNSSSGKATTDVPRARVVVPGDPLAVVEEYFPDPDSAYEDEDGFVRALKMGLLAQDEDNRIIGVKDVRTRVLPKVGMWGIGIVTQVKSQIAMISVYYLEGKLIDIPHTGILHVSNTSTQYVETMYDIMRAGDWVKFKIKGINVTLVLTTKGPGLGVVLARCIDCSAILKRLQGNILLCTNCVKQQQRLVSKDYEQHDRIFQEPKAGVTSMLRKKIQKRHAHSRRF